MRCFGCCPVHCTVFKRIPALSSLSVSGTFPAVLMPEMHLTENQWVKRKRQAILPCLLPSEVALQLQESHDLGYGKFLPNAWSAFAHLEEVSVQENGQWAPHPHLSKFWPALCGQPQKPHWRILSELRHDFLCSSGNWVL